MSNTKKESIELSFEAIEKAAGVISKINSIKGSLELVVEVLSKTKFDKRLGDTDIVKFQRLSLNNEPRKDVYIDFSEVRIVSAYLDKETLQEGVLVVFKDGYETFIVETIVEEVLIYWQRLDLK
jgi:hypothetical protein